MSKKKHDKGRIFVKVIAAILALLMIFSIMGTLIYYLVD